MEILYGTLFYCIDVTKICYSTILDNNIIKIPAGDINRIKLFSDPAPNTIKYIYIVKDNCISYQYNDMYTIEIDIATGVTTHY